MAILPHNSESDSGMEAENRGVELGKGRCFTVFDNLPMELRLEVWKEVVDQERVILVRTGKFEGEWERKGLVYGGRRIRVWGSCRGSPRGLNSSDSDVGEEGGLESENGNANGNGNGNEVGERRPGSKQFPLLHANHESRSEALRLFKNGSSEFEEAGGHSWARPDKDIFYVIEECKSAWEFSRQVMGFCVQDGEGGEKWRAPRKVACSWRTMGELVAKGKLGMPFYRGALMLCFSEFYWAGVEELVVVVGDEEVKGDYARYSGVEISFEKLERGPESYADVHGFDVFVERVCSREGRGELISWKAMARGVKEIIERVQREEIIARERLVEIGMDFDKHGLRDPSLISVASCVGWKVQKISFVKAVIKNL